MYYIISIFIGAMAALTLVQNGVLAERYGLYESSVIVHMVGLLIVVVAAVVKRRSPLPGKKVPVWMFLGGATGVITVVFSNLVYGKISVSAIMALGLLGQSIASMVIDGFGLFHMERRSFKKIKLVGIAQIMTGIIVMTPLSGANWLFPVILSLLIGVNIVVSRTFNSELSRETDALFSTMYNYITGLLTSVAVLTVARLASSPATRVEFSAQPWWMYFGGALGVLMILLLNISVSRISSFYMSLLTFIGQVFTGLILDTLTAGEFSFVSLFGGMLVTAGLTQNLFTDVKATRLHKRSANP